jgi:hypothetical protein
VVVAAVNSGAAVVKGKLGEKTIKMMLDSGSSVLLMQQQALEGLKDIIEIPSKEIHLVTAAGAPMPVLQYVSVSMQLGDFKSTQPFLVVEDLIMPVILGMDFLQSHNLTIDFASSLVTITPQHSSHPGQPTVISSPPPSSNGSHRNNAGYCAILSNGEHTDDTVDDCAVPLFTKVKAPACELPDCAMPSLSSLLQEFQDLFSTTPGTTNLAEHFIPTNGNPVKVPPRRIPANFRDEVEEQLDTMLKMGIIEECSSPWMAPTVFVRKKNGELRMCIDYRELNKKTVKDAYPLPRADEVQDRLAGSTIFSTLDLACGYWQIAVTPEDRPKTAFCPEPGMGLFQFTCMPFGLSGAPGSFQRLMYTVCRGLPFVTTYLDDVLIHSVSPEEHLQHLQEVFHQLRQAGLPLQGSKCQLGMSQVTYLEHVFSSSGMEPDPRKIAVVENWPTPSVSDVQSFLGLASYY